MPDLPWDDCTCRHAERPLGKLYGINMGRGIVRISTAPNCPRHDSCRGFTKAHRATQKNGSILWCPRHPKSACPVLPRPRGDS